MNTSKIRVYLLALTLGLVSMYVNAEPKNSEGQGKGGEATHSHNHNQSNHQHYHELVQAHMLKSGALTQSQIDERQAKMNSLYASMREAKENGDKKQFKLLKKEMSSLRKQHYKENKAYIDKHPDLKEEVMALHGQDGHGSDHGKKSHKCKDGICDHVKRECKDGICKHKKSDCKDGICDHKKHQCKEGVCDHKKHECKDGMCDHKKHECEDGVCDHKKHESKHEGREHKKHKHHHDN